MGVSSSTRVLYTGLTEPLYTALSHLGCQKEHYMQKVYGLRFAAPQRFKGFGANGDIPTRHHPES
jgi:hypothetical protein